MPAKSIAQRELFAIAEHDPSKLHKENKGLASLPHKTLHEFASGSEAGKPDHVKKDPPPMLKGSHKDVVASNTNSLKQSGKNEFDATREALHVAAKGHPHRNLGKFLHPAKSGFAPAPKKTGSPIIDDDGDMD